jgi:hypothetical protein
MLMERKYRYIFRWNWKDHNEIRLKGLNSVRLRISSKYDVNEMVSFTDI